MNFLSVERAGEIASICHRKMVEVKSDAEWSVATTGVDKRIVDFSTTWALLMQVNGKSPHEGAADETVGESLQYWAIRYKNPADTLEFLNKSVALLAKGWGHGILLKKWWNASPPTKRRLMSK
ncbi:MAG TPA: hypothetical protein VFH06_02165 [Candidatus Saccharimonadales bacterium]|nr:hypothetical protein [Candidatus Saccharimonadales bacterium]